MIKAIFLDRDCVINVDTGYTHKIRDFQFVEGIIDLLNYLKQIGYKLIIVTNQAGIAKGYYNEDDLSEFNNYLLLQLKKAMLILN